MTVNILVVTSSDELHRHVGIKKLTVFAKDVREKFSDIFRSCNISSVKVRNDQVTADVLNQYFIKYLDELEDVILIVEDRIAHNLGDLGTSCFLYIYDSELGGGNIHNYLGRVLPRLIKAYSYFSKLFDAEATRKMFLLPFRNFEAEDLRKLRRFFAGGVVLPGFEDNIDLFAKNMRQRQQPKTTSKSSKQYYIDDKDRFFSYGLERHAVPETSIPPHNHHCILNSYTRFGKAFDRRRHFNMSLATGLITGSFPDCHGDKVPRKNVEHVNIFPSDHIA
ncbi:hypothetical protein [Rhizobium sp. 2MFCol3.1]|uniref:hypothetical protein n=1 Tax=Rhizobium sp. 2MFCol3.1 TaxID=1246459 RepID=UPI00036FD177|nr:hypothetical protein [Rhizobium sp. 2MFCol3.1]